MSDILIKGMEMPKSCSECFVKSCKGRAKNKRLMVQCGDDCPLVLVPPHGRLIDGDVAEAITVNFDEAKGDFWDGILYAADFISQQPTIIPAEEGET